MRTTVYVIIYSTVHLTAYFTTYAIVGAVIHQPIDGAINTDTSHLPARRHTTTARVIAKAKVTVSPRKLQSPAKSN